ncbi:MAG: DUF6089 family protein [Bacteroidota bacterium]
MCSFKVLKKRHCSILVLLLCILPLFSFSQNTTRWKRSRGEFIFGLGSTNFLGELGGANRIGTNGFRDLEYIATRPLLNLGYSYKVKKNQAVQFDVTYGWLYGADKLTKEICRNNRNITFRTPLAEISGKYMYLFQRKREGHRYNLSGGGGRRIRGWRNMERSSYLFSGFAAFWFNPKGLYTDGSWHSLKPLSTEGQGLYASREPYHRVQFAIPIGGGFKLKISDDWLAGLEFGIRKTFTDYIDDVSTSYPDNDYLKDMNGEMAAYFSDPSLGLVPGQTLTNQQRGDPGDRDAYMFMTVTIRYKIPYSKRFFGIPKF